MEYLDADAAEAFYLLSIRSFKCGAIGSAGFDERMACLLGMLNPNDSTFEDFRRIVSDELLDQTRTVEEAELEAHIQRESAGLDALGSRRSGPILPEPPVLQLVVKSVSGMKKWIFHQFDEDPFPSIPHGHEYGRNHPKCDPYNGRVYDAGRNEVVSGRLAKKTRVALWQDQSFREFALKAIIWYEGTHWKYRFRVIHPRRLPRFRR